MCKTKCHIDGVPSSRQQQVKGVVMERTLLRGGLGAVNPLPGSCWRSSFPCPPAGKLTLLGTCPPLPALPLGYYSQMQRGKERKGNRSVRQADKPGLGGNVQDQHLAWCPLLSAL